MAEFTSPLTAPPLDIDIDDAVADDDDDDADEGGPVEVTLRRWRQRRRRIRRARENYLGQDCISFISIQLFQTTWCDCQWGGAPDADNRLHRYFQPHTLPFLVADDHVPSSSGDAALTAFAQLGALRCNTKRAIISLVGREQQHIIAEATRSLSLQSDKVHNLNDQLWFGCGTFAKELGICSKAVDCFLDKLATDDVPDASHQGTHVEVVHDLSKDVRFNKLPYVVASPAVRFSASALLCTPAGFIIGAYTLLDDKPRDGLSEEEAIFLQDIAQTVMEHLVVGQSKHQHYRAESLVKGIGLFVEGKSSLREWWINTGHSSRGPATAEEQRGSRTLAQQADHEFGTVESVDEATAAAAERAQATRFHPFTSFPRDSSGSSTSRQSTDNVVKSSLEVMPATPPTSLGFSTMEDQSVPGTPMLPSRLPSVGHARGSSPGRQANVEPDEAESDLTRDVKALFGRASNLMREAMAVEGVMFLDAGFSNTGDANSKTKPLHDPTTFRSDTSSHWSTSSDEDREKHAASQALAEGGDPTLSPSRRAVPAKMCDVLGFSTRQKVSINGSQPPTALASMPAAVMRKLLQRYPHGKVFNFDNEALSSSEDDHRRVRHASGTGAPPSPDTCHAKRKRRSKDAEGKSLLAVFQGVRSLVFFPLWDQHKERWLAGSFAWTTSVARVMSAEEEVTYLAAFGNSIMSSVASLHSVAANQMKADFISSISHELRSPLHGILASVEFLQETVLDYTQVDMIRTIDACGRTLLDTISHVLDFTKISTATKMRHGKRKQKRKENPRVGKQEPSEDVAHGNCVDVNLAVLTEEVVDGVLAGLGHGEVYKHKQEAGEMKGRTGALSTAAPTLGKLEKIMVVLDIDWTASWAFRTQPVSSHLIICPPTHFLPQLRCEPPPFETKSNKLQGAWRRIVQNLLGNSLKYSESGLIRLTLSCDTISPPSSRSTSHAQVTLLVHDTGKGISADYLQHHLYTPFAQEDTLAVGTGLGLSIVRQIVDSLDGTIDIKSEQGFGTDVRVSTRLQRAPLTQAAKGQDTDREDVGHQAVVHVNSTTSRIEEMKVMTTGKRVCLVNLDVLPDIEKAPTGILSRDAEGMLALRESLIAVLGDWFGIEVLMAKDWRDVEADIYVATAADVESWAVKVASEGKGDQMAGREISPGEKGGACLFILCPDVSSTLFGPAEKSQAIFLHQP